MWKFWCILNIINMLFLLTTLLLGIVYKNSYMFWIGLIIFYGSIRLVRYCTKKEVSARRQKEQNEILQETEKLFRDVFN